MIERFSTLVDPGSRVNGLLLPGSPRFREVSLESDAAVADTESAAADAHPSLRVPVGKLLSVGCL